MSRQKEGMAAPGARSPSTPPATSSTRTSSDKFLSARAAAADARGRLESLLACVRDPRLEILRAIAKLRSDGALDGDQGMLLEVVESYLQEARR